MSGKYSYYIADQVMNGHEYTYDAYTYDKETDAYNVTGGSTNPWRERNTRKVLRNIYQGELQYKRDFGDHSIEAMFIVERQESKIQNQWVHSVPQTNTLPLIYFSDVDSYDDFEEEEARIGYIGQISYNFKDKYYLQLSGRRDASWKFAPEKRVGFFPSASAGWRITEEPFIENLLGEKSILNDMKIRGSYGELGDDDIGIGAFDYLTGYNYNQGVAILDGNPVIASRDKGQPITNITWFKSKITDIGVDAYFLDHKLSATFDYFYRLRTGLRGRKYDIRIPNELGYGLPDENVNSDAQYGIEGALSYGDQIGEVSFNVSGNASITRSKFISSYKPRFNNSWDQYRSSGENRYNTIYWGYTALGQFQSQEEIDNHPVNIDGRGNATLLPGDIIYEDVNNDGRIDGYDEAPIGYNNYNPLINFGLSFSVQYKGFDLTADFSGASGYSWNQEWETRIPFQNGGALNDIFLDRWHRENTMDPNSQWVPGKYPALRYNNGGHSNTNKNSTFWLHNVTYLRARTLELGYSLPENLLTTLKIQKARFYINGYNLFSIDNLQEFGIDPEVSDTNGLQYPQNKFVNVGVNFSI
jgi:TonB-linked SusC/RagA family outer membrane protein